MPEQLTQEARALRVDVRNLATTLEVHRQTVISANRRSKYAIIGMIVGIAVAVIATMYAANARELSTDVRGLQNAAAADTTQARTSACIQFNAQRAEIREAIKSSLFALVPPNVTPTPAQLATFDIYNRSVDAGLPYRDCSPAGLAAYFKSPPSDPATSR